MIAPYDDADHDSVRFYNRMARIVVAWSRIERSVDLILYSSHQFSPKNGKAIVSFRDKCRWLVRLFRSLPDQTIGVNRGRRLIAELKQCAEIRHTLIHGYCHGLVPNEQPPRIHFRRARYNPSDVEQHSLLWTHDEMFEFLVRVQRLDGEASLTLFAIITHQRRKAGLARPPGYTD